MSESVCVCESVVCVCVCLCMCVYCDKEEETLEVLLCVVIAELRTEGRLTSSSWSSSQVTKGWVECNH